MSQKQKPPKEPPPRILTPEERQALKELDEEFPADKPEGYKRPTQPPDAEMNIGGVKVSLDHWGEYERAVTHKRDRAMLGGVFSHLADKFGLDDTGLWVLRIVGVTAGIALGFPILLYLIAWIIMPKD